MTIDFSNFGISDHFWTDFEYQVLADDGSITALPMRVKYARDSKQFRRNVTERLEKEFDQERQEFTTRLDATRERIISDESIDASERQRRIAEMDREFRAELQKLGEKFDTEIFRAVVLGWDWTDAKGNPVPFEDEHLRAQVLDLFPGLAEQIVRHWRETSSEAAIRKN